MRRRCNARYHDIASLAVSMGASESPPRLKEEKRGRLAILIALAILERLGRIEL